MNRVYVDLDGPTVDFAGYVAASGKTPDEIKAEPGAYAAMQPVPGAIEAIRSLIGMGFDVRIATKPPTGVAHAYAGKAQWVLDWLPELKRKITLTHDKGELGDAGDFLIDDRPHKANCVEFAGFLICYGGTWVAKAGVKIGGRYPEPIGWPHILTLFRSIAAQRKLEMEGSHMHPSDAILRARILASERTIQEAVQGEDEGGSCTQQ